MKKIAVIGSGFSGIAAATVLANEGYSVDLIEKNDSPGGRARKFSTDGFTFDMGPSWYWMPDVFERYFALFGKKPSDYYNLKRLDPSYKIFFQDNDIWDIPANLDELKVLLEKHEEGASKKLDAFLSDAEFKYEVGMNDLVYKPGLSITEFIDKRVLKATTQLQLFSSFSKLVRKYFSHPKILELLEFPVLFLGAKPEKTPALYSLMNYADIKLGTWYPMGGMHKIIEGMLALATEKGVNLKLSHNVEKIEIENGVFKGLQTSQGFLAYDGLVAAADYAHVDQKLLPKKYRNYTDKYWDKRVMAPSSLLYYVGIKGRVENLSHHNLFFDADFGKHAIEIYDKPSWPKNPLFYLSAPSLTDDTVAPENCENLFFLIPLAPDLGKDTEEQREVYFNMMLERLKAKTGNDIKDRIIYKRSFCVSDFIADYNAFKGNAYGLANTLRQTAILKPSLMNKKIENMVYAGQLTVPGPGVPPSLISGQIAAQQLIKRLPVV